MMNWTQEGQESGRIRPGISTGEQAADEVIARFGEARLLRVDGRVVLRGGSMTDRMEALEWVALFMPEAAPSLKG